jgi:hypothetical protein
MYALRATRGAKDRTDRRRPVSQEDQDRHQLEEVEPANLDVSLELGGVRLEIVNGEGEGFATILDRPSALQMCVKVLVALKELETGRN